jgi:hypothetical protein
LSKEIPMVNTFAFGYKVARLFNLSLIRDFNFIQSITNFTSFFHEVYSCKFNVAISERLSVFQFGSIIQTFSHLMAISCGVHLTLSIFTGSTGFTTSGVLQLSSVPVPTAAPPRRRYVARVCWRSRAPSELLVPSLPLRMTLGVLLPSAWLRFSVFSNIVDSLLVIGLGVWGKVG